MELENKVTIAKNNSQLLNELISEYKPFIRKTVYETCHRYVEWGRDEELSIGLMAFEEAVKRFNPARGFFLSIAKQTIRSRVIDYLRKESKNFIYNIDEINEIIIDNLSTHERLSDEIYELELYLKDFNISFQQLPEISPVKKNLRDELKQVARYIASLEIFTNHLLEKKYLPMKKIAKDTDVSIKKLERNRIYIITMVLIMHLRLPLLQDYVK